MIKKWLAKIGRFTLGGVLGAAIYYVVLLALLKLNVWYMTAFITAQIVNSGVNFIIQKQWTFKHFGMKGVSIIIIQHILVSILQFLIGIELVYLLVEFAHIPKLIVPFVLVIPRTILAYYLASWIFRKK